jgi:hypothetical protein
MRGVVSRPLWSYLLTGILFFIGAGLGTSFLKTSFEWVHVAIAAALATGVWAASQLRSARAAIWRAVGWAASLALLGCYALWSYLALVFGLLLGWTVPDASWWLAAATGLAALLALAWRRLPLRVPLVLPLGILIASALAGWLREENLLRCDDVLALRAPVELVVPTQPQLATCRPGEVRPAGRFPRTIWQAPDGQRVIFTTQGQVVDGGLTGSVCEAQLGSETPPRCIGTPINKSQGLIELADRRRLLVMQWGIKTPAGTPGAVVYEIERDGGLQILAEHWFDKPLGDGFYEPRNATLYMFSDEMDAIYPVVLPGFTAAPKIPLYFAPGELHYDGGRGEGVACGNHIGAAIRGAPFELRFLAGEHSALIERLSMTWGCDWNPPARTVYTTVPNLGLLDKINYDTGAVEQRWFVGPGLRSVEYDEARQRVYMTNFLRGEVVALDEKSGRLVDRWFVGRFSRWVRLTPDGSALLATGNLGIVRIPLAPADISPHARTAAAEPRPGPQTGLLPPDAGR